jgi:phosphomannomutase
MTLIKSISGIRGTIGGKEGEGLSPFDIIRFTTAYALWVKSHSNKEKIRIVVGRDARISGSMVEHLVLGSLSGIGADVIHIGLATTPTTEIAVIKEKADGGLILTASHNPRQWNALKLLNEKGEFLSDKDGKQVLEIASIGNFEFAMVDELGKIDQALYNTKHIEMILQLPLVDVDAIRNAHFSVAIDCINSVGGMILPELLNALGVENIYCLNEEPSGNFAHNPEPIPENLSDISTVVIKNKADVGFVVDPDVDRLAIIKEDGTMFGEEYTLVAVSDYILQHTPGNTVSNLSSSMALRDVTIRYGGNYVASAVGEVNVVKAMKETNAIIGGEGNGGVIYPALHYGRDALVGIALFLSHLAKSKVKCSELRKKYPEYFISKNKIQLTPEINVDNVLLKIKKMYQNQKINDVDGVRIDFDHEWVHLRKSNTEPIIRIYSESSSEARAQSLAATVMNDIKRICKL